MMDYEAEMAQALGEQRFFEHTDQRHRSQKVKHLIDTTKTRHPAKHKREPIRRALRSSYVPLAKAVGRAHRVDYTLIASDSRERSVIDARRHFITALIERTGQSYTAIGSVMGLHHTNVIYHHRMFKKLRADFGKQIEMVEAECPAK